MCFICRERISGAMEEWEQHYSEHHTPQVHLFPRVASHGIYGLKDYLSALQEPSRPTATLQTIGYLNRCGMVLTDIVQKIDDGVSFAETITSLDDVLGTLTRVRQAITTIAMEDSP